MKVAVVGSGPGGLICAEDLLRLGYAVTVFEASSVPGGLLIRGMPAYKLAKSVVERRIQLMRERGVTFRLGVKVCEDRVVGGVVERNSTRCTWRSARGRRGR
jgi:glutamate synthase (NADPH) small chain